MQILASCLPGRWVIDRSRALAIGQINGIILDPTTLKIAYFEVDSIAHDTATYLRSDQVALQGEVLTIASESTLGEKSDFLRDQALLDEPCLLMGYRVKDRAKRKLGKVSDYTVSSPSFRVERVHVGVPFWQRLLLPERIISAKHIHEVITKSRQIIIDQSSAAQRVRVRQTVPA